MSNAPRRRLAHDCGAVSAEIIVSYDGTPNDDDALALGKILAATGRRLALAYVRHSREFDPQREKIAQHDAERRLEQGAAVLEAPDIPRHVVISASTGAGLAKLAEDEGASIIVFGSDYRTPPGRVEPGATAQFLLEGGGVAVAVAPAGLRTFSHARIASIAVAQPEGDGAVEQTASGLAEKLGASVSATANGPVDLMIVGSQAGAPEGRIVLSGATRSQLDSARSAVLVLPRGKSLAL
jgi:nucleotide-binding universal stress UspA family protein